MDESTLRKKSYTDLYELYDKSKDPKERSLIKKVVDDLPLAKTDANFQPYPDHYAEDFNKIIYNKREFHPNQLFLDTSGIENSCNSEFSIKSHQSFLKNFMTKESPYKSLLIYHGVGVGKTCSGLTIAENFRDVLARKEKRIIILSSKNIQIGWKKTIYDPDKGSNQCTGETFIDSNADTDRGVNKLVKQYYELMAYQSFSNFVNRMVKQYSQRFPKNEEEKREKEKIKEYFSNRLLIIDEVHNIRDEQGPKMRNTIKTIKKVIEHSSNLRLVLLTATPMYNRVNEILWILNMMLLNDKRPTIDKADVFDRNGELTTKGGGIIKDKCRGYVSYLRGENPITFPIRLYPRHLSLKPKKASKRVINPKNTPSLNLVGGKIKPKDRLKFLELFGSHMSKEKLQLYVYERRIKSLLDDNPDIDIDARGEKNPIEDNIELTQITNMVYPSEKDEDELSLNEFYGEKGLNNCMERHGSKYTYKNKVLDKYGKVPIFDKDTLKQFSCKIARIIESVNESDGIVFIYTTYISSGTIPLQLAFEQNGYKKHTGEPILKWPEWTKSSDNKKTKGEPISYNGKLRSDVLKKSEEFIQGKYMVIDGSTTKKILQHQLKIVNSDENKQGEKIKIIIGTVVASEGLDFKKIRSVHILDPWPHLNRTEQTVGRAIRLCSHMGLPDNQRNVLIYLHVAMVPKDAQGLEHESIDLSIYRYAEKKSIEIGKVEIMLKEEAVDRYLFRDVNVIRKDEIGKVKMDPASRSAKEISIDLSDKSYSKVCSYSKECDYNKKLPELSDCSDKDKTECKGPGCTYSDSLESCEYKLNDDTFIEQYSSTVIHIIKKKITLLYKTSYVYDIYSILGLLDEYGFYQEKMIYLAMTEMIIHKFTVYDKYGNSGYLINRGIYYIFQPSLLGDESIPLYYRMNLIGGPLKHITLPRVNEVIDLCHCNSNYSEPDIRDVYDRLRVSLEQYKVNITIPGSRASILKGIAKQKGMGSALSANHKDIIWYEFDRLLFEDKCKLMYGFLDYPESKFKAGNTFHDNLREILHSFCIYKDSGEEYYFNEESKIEELKKTNKINIFGFALTSVPWRDGKPCFYEYHNKQIQPCIQSNEVSITRSLRRYLSTSDFKEFKKTPDKKHWGYGTEGGFKFVEYGVERQGAGNVCMGDNPAGIKGRDNIIKTEYPELQRVFDKHATDKDKKCFILEVVLRINKSFFPYDKVWLRYYKLAY